MNAVAAGTFPLVLFASVGTTAGTIASFIVILGLLGAGLRLVVRVTRTIDGQLEAMRDNTSATNHLTEQMEPLAAMVQRHDGELRGLIPRVSALEGNRRRPRAVSD